MKSEKSLIVSKGIVFGLLSVLLFVPEFAMAVGEISNILSNTTAVSAMKIICILAGIASLVDAVISAMSDQGSGAMKKALSGLVLIGLGLQWKEIVAAFLTGV